MEHSTRGKWCQPQVLTVIIRLLRSLMRAGWLEMKMPECLLTPSGLGFMPDTTTKDTMAQTHGTHTTTLWP
ncbi:hypothetical protein TNIN_76491 [Trichonephila inaurata madagascariensis]|uniref:Uncharacterized protein n=1 Tax=Trichonephila inaurata madagascariensis TaxID=2747483 RepID=A0A8X6M5U7_9ARAC|nr:hypothetical protein TNIN_76491 [Trichonephila inaurata madagascariensis]